MFIKILILLVLLLSEGSLAMLKNKVKINHRMHPTRISLLPQRFYMTKLNAGDPWQAARRQFLMRHTDKNHGMFIDRPELELKADQDQENNDPLYNIKSDIKEIFKGNKLSDSLINAGDIAHKELEKLDHIDPDLGTRWRACQLTAMGIYLLKKLNAGKLPDDIAVALYLLQIDKRNHVREKKYMVRELKNLGIYDYIANGQYLNKDIHNESITIAQYNRLLIYLRRNLQKKFLDAIYESSGMQFEDYGLLESNSEWSPKDRTDAYEHVIKKLIEQKAPILMAIYPGTPGQSEVRTLVGVGWIYLYRYSDSLGEYQLVEEKIPGQANLDSSGYFIIHVGLGQYGLSAKNFLKQKFIETFAPQVDNINPIDLMRHRFKMMNYSPEKMQSEDILSWPNPDFSMFHFSFRSGLAHELQKKVNQRRVSYYRNNPQLADKPMEFFTN